MNTSKKFDFNNFNPHPFPKPGSDEWLVMINSGQAFRVSGGEKGLCITRYKAIDTLNFDFEDVSIAAHYNGEWGGIIDFKSKQDQHIMKVMPRRMGTIFIFEQNNNVYFVESLGHLYTSIGALCKLRREHDTFEIDEVFDLGEAPEACVRSEEGVYMISDKNLCTVREKEGVWQKEYIVQDLPFGGLYPNSLVKEGDVFYVGMWGGMVKIDPAKEKEKFTYLTLRV